MPVEAIYDFTSESIPFEEGRFLFDLWNSKKEIVGKIPSRADFSPLELKDILPSICLFDVLEDTQEIRRRVIGTHVAFCLGIDLTSKVIKTSDYDKSGIKNPEEVIGLLEKLVEDSKPYICTNVEILNSPEDYTNYSCLYLPLCTREGRVEKIICVMKFY